MLSWRASGGTVMVVCGIGCGVLFGVAISMIMIRAHRTSQATDHDLPTRSALVEPAPEARSEGEIDQLRLRVTALESRTEPGVGASAAPITVPSAAIAPSRDEVVRELASQQEATLRRFREEGTDPGWARDAKRMLERDFDSLGVQNGTKLTASECRTTLCVADLAWPNYESARSAARSILTKNYSLNCRRSLFIPTPEDMSKEYSAEIIFDCESMRADSR
jgi:hypothetical protein